MIASTWNHDIAEAFGEKIGKMADEMKVSGWYAPAMNIHRCAFAAVTSSTILRTVYFPDRWQPSGSWSRKARSLCIYQTFRIKRPGNQPS